MKAFQLCLFAFFTIVVCVFGGGVGGDGRMGNIDSKKIRIAYLTKGTWKMCLEIDSGLIAPAKQPIDLLGFLHVSQLEVITQFCEDFRLSEHVVDFLVVVPDRVGSKCYHFEDCQATIMLRSGTRSLLP